nr:kinetochore protein SPC24 homolog [Ipomoea batatas]GMD77852.1 kinetochore protein SPC24 homolog [Ipomoea batatas]
MGDGLKNFDVEKLMLWSNDLVEVLKDGEDVNSLKQLLEQSNSLQSQCNTDFNDTQGSIEDYEKKVDMCKRKTLEAKSEALTDAEIESLQKDLEEELQRESLLREELRVIAEEMNDLEHQRFSIEEQGKSLKQLERDDSRAEMKLSLFASVTNIIPSLDDQSKISGYIVQRDKNAVEDFDFDPKDMSEFETCNRIWKMINLDTL